MKAKSIMVLGTTSNAGKSLIAAALCRIFAQDGLRVAPFKSQNMALNSYVTADGLEISRSQVTQAQCAGVAPDVRMNPILLKPTSNQGSQVIVNGEVVGNMSAADYYAYKHTLQAGVLEAYHSLASENDLIVIEGAGSPAEINLKQDDFVNMGLAQLVSAPAILVADIDRGGVFASVAGTNLLFTEEERRYFKGVVINKFRGDKEILNPGLVTLENLIHKPVLGVVPFLPFDIDDEDSLSDRFHSNRGGVLDIVVIHIPRISNFTDFSALSAVDGVGLRYVRSADELGNPDLIFLPGSKNTMSDLLWMRQNGLEASILKYADAGGAVFGICGGYQMLGSVLSDPDGLESGGELAGMGLLPMKTRFTGQKSRRQVQGRFEDIPGFFQPLSGAGFEGYEIHMGITEPLEDAPRLARFADGQLDGMACKNVCGCYVHGVFDAEEAVDALLQALLTRRGLAADALKARDFVQYREEQFDILADGVRAALDMEKIKRIIQEGM